MNKKNFDEELYKMQSNAEINRSNILFRLSKSKEDKNLKELYSFCSEFSRISENYLLVKSINNSNAYVLSLNDNKFLVTNIDKYAVDSIDKLIELMVKYITYDIKIKNLK